MGGSRRGGRAPSSSRRRPHAEPRSVDLFTSAAVRLTASLKPPTNAVRRSGITGTYSPNASVSDKLHDLYTPETHEPTAEHLRVQTLLTLRLQDPLSSGSSEVQLFYEALPLFLQLLVTKTTKNNKQKTKQELLQLKPVQL